MNKLIEKTGITFGSGGKLSSTDLNTLNNKINELVDAVNNGVLKADFNVNIETGDMTRTWTLKQAIYSIPDDRKALAINIRFLEDNNGTPGWITYYYTGTSLDTFSDPKFWETDNFDIIDGGEW